MLSYIDFELVFTPGVVYELRYEGRDVVSVKQLTRYASQIACTYDGVLPEFCLCNRTSFMEHNGRPWSPLESDARARARARRHGARGDDRESSVGRRERVFESPRAKIVRGIGRGAVRQRVRRRVRARVKRHSKLQDGEDRYLVDTYFKGLCGGTLV